MNTRIIALLVAVFLATSATKSQNNFNGTVKNKDGVPLGGANISFLNSYLGSFSRSDGSFKLQKIPNGSYTVIASYLGYKNDTTELEFQGGKEVIYNFSLEPSPFKTEEVIISASRAADKTPTTYTSLSKDEIQRGNFAQDLPYLLELTPSTVITSDAGAGVGYTGIRIRGSDQSRINVTINGIPINDAESHGVFWVNMPDFASSVNDIQIQRGVGTSANGAAAFGASINVQTDKLIPEAYAEVANAYGSFNTLRNTVKFGSGLINDKFAIDGRLSRISSDGYIDRASSDLRSFYLSAAYYGKKDVLRVNIFSGKEITYQAWNGVSAAQMEENRTFNSAGMYFNSNGEMMFYDREVDDYQQDHYQLHYTRNINKNITFNQSLHYTYGRGYFEQFRQNDRYSTYSISPVVLGGSSVTFNEDFLLIGSDTIRNNNPGTDTTITIGQQVVDRTDLVRRRWLDNHFYGFVGTLNFDNKKNLNVTLGWGANRYDGDHFGEVIWANLAPQTMIRDRYYDNRAIKDDYHIYAKASFQLTNKLNLFADLQYRGIDYQFEGLNVVNDEAIVTDQKVHFDFFNPKAGLFYEINEKNLLYSSISIANREPVRRDFTESTPDSRPTHETLRNIEAGYKFRSNKLLFNANYYLMDYKNQLVLTGQINDVGAYTRTNIDQSHRMGIELETAWRPFTQLMLGGNLTVSRNKINQFSEFIDNFDDGTQVEIIHQNTDIAFSPNFIAGGQISYFPIGKLELSLLPKYVGQQYLDNTSNSDRALNAFFVTHFRINYSFTTSVFKEVRTGLLVYNLNNLLYESNGYTFSYVAGGEFITENYFYPQAPRNFLVNVSFLF